MVPRLVTAQSYFTPKRGRQYCLVPFCPNHHPDNGRHTEWMCTEHGKQVPRLMRKLYAKRMRSKYASPEEKQRYVLAMWQAIKVHVIERQFGIG